MVRKSTAPPPVLSPATDEERLAICLFDVDRIDADVRQRVLIGRLDLGGPGRGVVRGGAFRIGVDPKDQALAFSCPLLVAATAADFIQSQFRSEGDAPARFYVFLPDRGWARAPRDVAFVIDDGEGGRSLNPAVFPSAVIEVEYVPPEYKGG
jgi:hypothetical protein